MAFAFKPHAQLEICGRVYEADVTDNDFVIGVTTNLTEIFKKYEDFNKMRQQVQEKAQNGLQEGELNELTEQLINANQELLLQAKGFIERALGREAYEEIFRGRKPNSVDHIELCNYIYEQVLKSREKMVKKYLRPAKTSKHAGGRRSFFRN